MIAKRNFTGVAITRATMQNICDSEKTQWGGFCFGCNLGLCKMYFVKTS